ncbi:LIM domain-containing protein A [Drosophila erecta]|uniref:Uncharacterized protein n=1 Tax=Drosophila erecta TaxID=7220 RepID=B3NW58_DROER|nr:LIM domain-containing protein A [Drosophila erecta]EDV46191.2 uncharacterized protein Dere_GG18348 [Drosophila erecta]
MAAHCRRYRSRSRRPKCSKTMSLAALILGLSLVVVTLAAGNDAISAPKAVKDQPSEMEDDGAGRPDKDFDFTAYVNDFNLQEEASIPEDIFDQHDGDIVDEDVESAHIQYAPSAPTAPFAASATAEEEDEEDVDVGLLEEDDDASEAADIILESQRPTSRNFSVYLDAKKYQNSNSKKHFKEQKKNNISHHQNYKLKNNKEYNHHRLAMEAAAGKSEMETVLGGGTKFTSGDEKPQQEDQEQVEQEEQEESANFGRQSFAYKKLKSMHEQPSQQDKKRGDDGDEADLLEGDYPPSQLFDAIEILNERKFNKPSGQSTDKSRSQLQKKQKDQSLQEQQKSRQVDEAIGDIDIDSEDNLDNDEILPNNNGEDEDAGDDDEDEDIKSPIDNDELARKYPVATSMTTKVPTTLATSKTSSSSINSISSTTTTTTATATSTTATSPTTTTTPRAAAATIGRKLKRNFLGLAPPETRYYGSYDIGRIRAQTQEEDTTEEEKEKDEDVGELHYYDTSSGGNARKLVSFDPEKSEENYLGSYYPGKLNATEKKQQQHVVARQQHATRYVDDDYAEQQPPAEKTKLENPWEKSDGKPEDAEQLEDGKLESDLESALQRYHEATTATPPVTADPSSAFERFKALRRSRQRTGHKSHKKRYKDYLKRQQPNAEATSPPETAPAATISTRHLQKLQKERERSTHSAPIFALGLRPQRTLVATGKPFYEGQVNYYDNQQQTDVDLKHHTEMERLIAHDNGNWYRRISPVLRNGVKSDPPAKEHHHHHHHSGQHLGNHHHHHSHSHHHSYNHNGAHNHHHHSHSHQKLSHPKTRPRNPYQRKVSMGMADPSPPPPPTPPLPPPKPQLGHQITELEHLERYYAKWPHLARVQFQVYDEHYRETHPELYSDYEDDYESAAELEEAQQERGEEANLPPYIKKYNRRNKQLLNLLEGTLPTPTLSAGNPLGSTETVRLDDEYLKEKRRRYHQHQRFEDLFAQQKSRYSTTQTTPKEEVTVAQEQQSKENPVTSTTSPNNQLPEEDAPVVSGEESDPAAETLDFWQREMASKAGKMRSSQPGGAASTTTPKPALFKLPSYPAIAGSFLGTPRSRSRSAQFVANVAGRGQSSWPRLETGSSTEKPAGGGTTEGGGTATTGRGAGGGGGGGGGGRGDPSPLNSFVYHRVVDGIGVGGASGPAISGFVGSSRGKQSRLPFVAITDRRLEKSLAERHKDFEQNHFPMP